MFDYNTHKDFGSGDRICYHGVMDMFRNPKLAAAVYSSQQEDTPVLELSSSMDIGEHPGGNRSGNWMITNADAVRMYKNSKLIKEYHREDSPYRALAHGPIPVNDFIGNAIVENEPMKPKQARLIGQLLKAEQSSGKVLPSGIATDGLLSHETKGCGCALHTLCRGLGDDFHGL